MRAGTIFFHPLTQILVNSVLVAASQIFLRLGAAAEPTTGNQSVGDSLGLGALDSGWVWVGILLLILSFGSWLLALRSLSLTVAFALSNLVHVLVPLGSWWWLGEDVSVRRWLGIALVLVGLLILAGPLARLEGGGGEGGKPSQ